MSVKTAKLVKAKITKLELPASVVLAQATKAQRKIEQSRPDNEDKCIDRTCKSYKGFVPGQLAYMRSPFDSTAFGECVILGFTVPLCVGNPFSDAETQAGGFRAIIAANTYKGKLQGPNSYPPRSIVASPVAQTHKCPYCKKDTTVTANCGACNKPRCILQAMRDNR